MAGEAGVTIIGGAGAVGRRLCRILAAEGDRPVVVAGRSIERAKAVAAMCHGRAVARFADVAVPESVAPAVDGSALVVVAAPCYSGIGNVARACVAAGADYADILARQQIRRELDSLSAGIDRAGRLFATHGGVGSGLPSLLLRAATTFVPDCESVRLGMWISLKGVTRPEEAFDLVDAAAECGPIVYRGRRWRRVSGARELTSFEYGAGFGTRMSVPLDLAELHGLAEQLDIESVSAYAATPNWPVDLVFRWLVSAAYSIHHGLGRTVFSRGLLAAARRAAPRRGACLVADVRDRRGARRLLIRLTHDDVLEWTACVLAVFVRQYFEGRFADYKGVRMMGHVLDVTDTLHALEKMGMTLECHESPPMR